MRETASRFAGASLQMVTLQRRHLDDYRVLFRRNGLETTKGAGRGASALLLACRKSNQQPSRFTEVIRLAFAHK
jgi:hypothetical protein